MDAKNKKKTLQKLSQLLPSKVGERVRARGGDVELLLTQLPGSLKLMVRNNSCKPVNSGPQRQGNGFSPAGSAGLCSWAGRDGDIHPKGQVCFLGAKF